MNRLFSDLVQYTIPDLFHHFQWTCDILYGRAISDGWLVLFQPPVYNKAGSQLLQIQPKSVTG